MFLLHRSKEKTVKNFMINTARSMTTHFILFDCKHFSFLPRLVNSLVQSNPKEGAKAM